MTKIDSHYDLVRDQFKEQEHRAYIGGLWEEIGELQLTFLKRHGLQPQHKLLDIGCGSLRGGIKFIEYLQPLHYFGMDINPHLIARGRELELNKLQKQKINDTSFTSNANFSVDFAVDSFDYGIAFSLFTHLPPERIEECLKKLRPKFRTGTFFATFFEVPSQDYQHHITQKMGITTKPNEDPYHYTLSMIEELANKTDWSLNWIGDFNHPRNQKMAAFS